MRHGFSLVELSIVLVILGLLVGGILAGKSLIRASELRSVTSESNRYIIASNSFRDKYFGVPGDLYNAESFWGTQVAGGSCDSTASTDSKTCNGDGDGYIETISTKSREIFRAWQHLANAGLIEGQYSGIWVGNSWAPVPGTNVPNSKLSGSNWFFASKNDVTNVGGFYTHIFQPANSSNWLELEKGSANAAAVTPEEAWNIDTKGDDGMPGMGKITTFDQTYSSTCVSSNTASAATYVLTTTSLGCTMFFGM